MCLDSTYTVEKAKWIGAVRALFVRCFDRETQPVCTTIEAAGRKIGFHYTIPLGIVKQNIGRISRATLIFRIFKSTIHRQGKRARAETGPRIFPKCRLTNPALTFEQRAT